MSGTFFRRTAPARLGQSVWALPERGGGDLSG